MTNVFTLNIDTKVKAIDTYQKKANWRLFSNNGGLIQFPEVKAKSAKDSYIPVGMKLYNISSARLSERMVYGSNCYFELDITVSLDSKAFNDMKRKKELPNWIGRTNIDLSNFFWQQFGLPCRCPSVDTKKRAKGGVKSVRFVFGFDISSDSYSEQLESKKRFQDIAKDISVLLDKLKLAG